jgi:hypothetical protein
MDPLTTPHGKAAAEFANALVKGDFDRAHAMMSSSARLEWTAAALGEAYGAMVEYFEAPPTLVQVVEVMSDWPGKVAGDVGWAYAAIVGDDASEAVIVVVCSEGGKPLIRTIEWGRP